MFISKENDQVGLAYVIWNYTTLHSASFFPISSPPTFGMILVKATTVHYILLTTFLMWDPKVNLSFSMMPGYFNLPFIGKILLPKISKYMFLLVLLVPWGLQLQSYVVMFKSCFCIQENIPSIASLLLNIWSRWSTRSSAHAIVVTLSSNFGSKIQSEIYKS